MSRKPPENPDRNPPGPAITAGLDEAASALDAFVIGPASKAAGMIGDAFALAGRNIAGALESAARSGELSVSRLAQSILRDLSSIALDRFVTQPLAAAIAGIGQLPLAGARAAGGPVTAGGAYLVGERGPELFMPAQTGSIEQAGFGGPLSITINMAPGASLDDARRSSAQVAAALARAVQRGGRRL
jgi:phage-related minor tail protein